MITIEGLAAALIEELGVDVDIAHACARAGAVWCGYPPDTLAVTCADATYICDHGEDLLPAALRLLLLAGAERGADQPPAGGRPAPTSDQRVTTMGALTRRRRVAHQQATEAVAATGATAAIVPPLDAA